MFPHTSGSKISQRHQFHQLEPSGVRSFDVKGKQIKGEKKAIKLLETFEYKPEKLTEEEKKEFLASVSSVALGSDAFFPFSDNIERAYRSGVKYIAEPGGSIRDDAVIDCCNKYGMAMAFTGMRLFHH